MFPHSPRAVLKKAAQARLEAMGFDAMMATELEFFLFEKSFDEIRKEKFRDLEPISVATTRTTRSCRPPRKNM